MTLKDLSAYKNIVIQCPDIPDADAIGSGYALTEYLTAQNHSVTFIYTGEEISKPNLKCLIETLNIPLKHTDVLPEDTDLLVTIDCQYGQLNVTKFETTAKIAIIDHHQTHTNPGELICIRPAVGSCSSVVWSLMCQAGYDFEKEPQAAQSKSAVSTALYFGLLSDTNNFAEISHPLDLDMRDSLRYDRELIRRLKNEAITLPELDIIGTTFSNYKIIGDIGLFSANAVDPNLLGFINDIVLQTKGLNSCIVYSKMPRGLKLSVRSCVREIMANEFAEYICKDAGGGGGNIEKAGGFISFESIADPRAVTSLYGTAWRAVEFLEERVRAYNETYEKIYCTDKLCTRVSADGSRTETVSFDDAPKYRKLPNPVGYIPTADIFEQGTMLTVRALVGDIDVIARSDIYIMIGVAGEIYPINAASFEKCYIVSDAPYKPGYEEKDYMPTITNRLTGARAELTALAKTCTPKAAKTIHALRLTRDTKVFGIWDAEKYSRGHIGDYIARDDNHMCDGECYVIRKNVFDATYTEMI